MASRLLKWSVFGAAALAVSWNMAAPAHADPALPNLENLNFLQYHGSAPKNTFRNVNPVGWTGGSGLIFIDAPGTSNTSTTTACGTTYLQTYGCPSTLHISGGYNFVEADGNPDFGSGFNYAVTGLTAGQTYTLSFYQAASQQTGFSGNTTNQWIVALGTEGLEVTSLGGCDPTCSTYADSDPNASVVATSLMHAPSGGLVDWNYVTVDLTADSTTDILSFLAWGDNGSTANEPPMAFLAGVDSAAGLEAPEPASLALFGVGLLGLGAAVWRRRGNRSTSS